MTRRSRRLLASAPLLVVVVAALAFGLGDGNGKPKPRAKPLAAEFLAADTWATIRGPSWVLKPWRGRYRLSLGVPMLPRSEVPGAWEVETIAAKLEQGARGDFDAHFTMLARRLVSNGQANAYVRLGWEFNGDWYIWRADANVEAWKRYWRRIVVAMRSVRGARFGFVWNPTRGAEALASHANGTEAAYPGDAWVDVVGLDVYDSEYGRQLAHAERWPVIRTGPYGVDWMLRFAAEHRKRWAFPEWGIVKDTGQPRYGGGDAAAFVHEMATLIKTRKPAYHLYWDLDADIRSRLSDGSAPAALAAYRSHFRAPFAIIGHRRLPRP